MKGVETLTVWGNFNPQYKQLSSNLNESTRNKLMKMSVQSQNLVAQSEAIPRLQEVHFRSLQSQYELFLLTQVNSQLQQIKRIGKDQYVMRNLETEERLAVSKDQVHQFRAYTELKSKCYDKVVKGLDPDFTYDDIQYEIVKVLSYGGRKTVYLATSELVSMESMSVTHLMKQQNQAKEQYIIKCYIMPNHYEMAVYKRQLQIYKVLSQRGQAPKLSWSHNDTISQGIILSYNSNKMHASAKDQHSLRSMRSESEPQVQKYLIISKLLENQLSLKDYFANKFQILQPYQRFSLVRKLIQSITDLEKMGIYHGQLLPQHIFISNIESHNPQSYQIKFTDFSESIDINGPESTSIFEAAVTKKDALPQWRDPYIRGYVPFSHKYRAALRMYMHPLLGYFRFHYQSVSPPALRYDIRKTEKYSLIILILILSCPNSDTQTAITRLLEKFTDQCVEGYASHQIKNMLQQEDQMNEIRSSELQSFLSQAVVILRKSYNQHTQISQSVKVFFDCLRQQLQESLNISQSGKKKKKKEQRVEKEEGLEGLMFKLLCDLNPIIDYFQGKEFRSNRSMTIMLGSGNRGFRSSTALVQKISHKKKKIQEFLNKNIFEKFFGEEWIDPNSVKEKQTLVVRHEQEKKEERFSEVKEEEFEQQSNRVSETKSMLDQWNKFDRPSENSQAQISFISKLGEEKQQNGKILLTTQRSDVPDIRVEDFTEKGQLKEMKESRRKQHREKKNPGTQSMISSLMGLTPREQTQNMEFENFPYRDKYQNYNEHSGSHISIEMNGEYSYEEDEESEQNGKFTESDKGSLVISHMIPEFSEGDELQKGT